MIPRVRAAERGGRWFQVIIQAKADSHSIEGEPVETWADSYTRSMQMTPLSGRERFVAQQTDQEVDYRFRVRWESGLFNGPRRLKYGSRLFHVVAAWDIEERNEWYEILATEKL